MTARSDRLRAAVAAGGLVAVTGAWTVAGLTTAEFDPLEASISQLHRSGTPTRALLTAGLLAYSVGMVAAAPVLGRALGSPTCRGLLTVVGAVTASAAVFPLQVEKGLPQDLPHMASAATGYLCVSLLPLVGARHLHGRARTASVAVGVVTAVAMTLTVPLHDVSGGLQRLGLTLGSGWAVVVVAAEAVRTGRGPLRRSLAARSRPAARR